MRAIDKLAQIVRRSVNMIWREKIDPVIAPAEISRKIGDRHHFDNGDADLGQLRELFGRRAPGAFPRERTDVHLVDDLAFHFNPGPLRIRPLELHWIDNAGRTVWAIRLKA